MEFSSSFPIDDKTGNSSGRLDFEGIEEISSRIAQMIILFLTIFSIITNAVVIRIFLSRKYGKITTAKILYANISLSDEMFLLACVFEATFFGNNCRGLCATTVTYITHVSGYVSAYTMAFLATKRYQVIAHPMKHRASVTSTGSGSTILFTKKTVFTLVLIWTIGILFALVFGSFTYFTEGRIDDDELRDPYFAHVCSIIRTRVMAFHNTGYFTIISMVLVPLCIGLWFSIRTILLLHFRKPVLGDANPDAQTEMQKQGKRKSVLMILLVLFAIICWTPVLGFYTYEGVLYSRKNSLSLTCEYNYSLYSVFMLMLMFQFIINPIIYWYFTPEFRRGFISMISICFRCSYCVRPKQQVIGVNS